MRISDWSSDVCSSDLTIALPVVRAALDIPVVGTVPAVKPAALASKSRVIGVLGTPATVRQPYVDRLANEFGADCIVLRHGSSDLVDYAEAKLRGETRSEEHTSELQSLMRISYAVFCLKKKKPNILTHRHQLVTHQNNTSSHKRVLLDIN